MLTITGEEFIRRFLLHILPPGFVRIRYYGLHHASARKEKLPRCRAWLGLPAELPEAKELSLLAWLNEVLGEEQVDSCPQCGAVVSQPTRQGVCR